MPVNTLLRIALLAWTMLFLAIACAPVYSDSGFLALIGFLPGWVLFVPWLVGTVVIGALIWLTNPRGRGPR